MVASTAEIEGLLTVLARIVRRLAAMPPGEEARADPRAQGEGEDHRGRRCDAPV